MKKSILKSVAVFTAAVVIGGAVPLAASAANTIPGDKMSLSANKTAVRPNETITVSVDIASSDEAVQVFSCGIELKEFAFVKNSVRYTQEPAMEGSVAINQRLAIAAVNRRNEMIPSGKAVEFDLQVPETEGVYNLEWYSGEVDGNRYVETAGITVKVSAFSGEFPCVLFGIDPWNSSVQLNAQTANINGNIGTNGKFSTTASNLNVNGTITENDHRNIEIIGERLTEQYFSGRNIQSVSENYEVTDNNINISNPIEVEGEINLDGNVSLNSGLSATEDVVIDGGNVNGNNSLIYSEKGNITVDASNKSYLGVIYAPAGTVEITSPSIHIQGVIIAQNIILNGDNITVTHDSNIAKIVGNTLDVTDDISLIGSKRTPMSDILANSKSLVSPSDLNKFFYDWSSGVVLSPDSGN